MKKKCAADVNGDKVVMYVDGDKFRLETNSKVKGINSSIYDGKDHWSWGEVNGEKFAIKMSGEEMEKQGKSPKGLAEMIMKKTPGMVCNEEDFSDDLFIPPKDREFVDIAEAIKKRMGN